MVAYGCRKYITRLGEALNRTVVAQYECRVSGVPLGYASRLPA